MRSHCDFEFHFDQQDLDELCRDRQLKTKELHPTNDFYGQASVLKRYARLPKRYSLKVVLEHAPVLHDKMWHQDRENMLPVNFSCSAARTMIMQKFSNRLTIPIGFGFFYAQALLRRMIGSENHLPDRKGTIVFPFKSTHMFDTNFDHHDYAERLSRLPESMKPIVICVFWKDYLRGAHTAYAEKGFQIVSAGHMFDQDFMLRLYDICRHFRYAVSNEFGTHVFLSVASGCAYSYLDSSKITRVIPKQEQADYVRQDKGFQEISSRSKLLFDELCDETTAEQQDFVDEILGAEFVLSPHRLRQLILVTESYDKLLPRRQENKTKLPPFWPRRIARLRLSVAKRMSFLAGTDSKQKNAA